MSGNTATAILGRSGQVFALGKNGVSTDAFEQQPKDSSYRAEYEATRQAMPKEHRNNDTLIDKAINEYFSTKLPDDSGVVQRTQARANAVDKVVDEHNRQLSATESLLTANLNAAHAASSAPDAPVTAQQASLANLPGAATLSNPTVRAGVQMVVNAEMAVLQRVSPQMAAAAQAGLRTGAALAYGAADLANPVKPEDLAQKDTASAPTPESDPKPSPIPAPPPLETDKNDKKTCAVIGAWVRDNGHHSANSQAYQDFITGRAETDFHVPRAGKPDLKYDGCKDQITGPVLLEAKAKHGEVITGSFSNEPIRAAEQGKEQQRVAQALGVRNELHVQMENERAVFETIYKEANVTTPVIHTPLPVVKK